MQELNNLEIVYFSRDNDVCVRVYPVRFASSSLEQGPALALPTTEEEDHGLGTLPSPWTYYIIKCFV